MTTYTVRIFESKGRKPIAYFIINHVRYIYTFTSCETLDELKSLDNYFITANICQVIHRNMPRLNGYNVELDILPFQKITNKEADKLFSYMILR